MGKVKKTFKESIHAIPEGKKPLPTPDTNPVDGDKLIEETKPKKVKETKENPEIIRLGKIESDINTLDNSKNSSIIYALHGGFSWSKSFFEDEEEDLRFFRKKYLHKNQLEAVKLLLDKKTKLTGNEIFSLLLVLKVINVIQFKMIICIHSIEFNISRVFRITDNG